MADPSRTSTGPRQLLRCDACSRIDEPTRDDLLRYTRQGWPKCCGQVMALFTEAAKPAPDDTKIDRPPLAD